MTIPHDATVTVNVHSTTSALRDIVTLMQRGGLTQMMWAMDEGLPMLADRIEEMYKEQHERGRRPASDDSSKEA